MRRLSLILSFAISAVLVAGSVPTQQDAQASDRSKLSLGIPAEVAKSAARYVAECESYGAAPSPTGKFIAPVDLNEDSASDYIIDTNEMKASCFCGSGGCTIEAWVSDGGRHGMAFQENVRGWQVSSKGSMPPVLIVDLHGTACGGVGADVCLKALVYRDGKMIETTAGQ